MVEPISAIDPSQADRFCIGCGYNLRELLSDRCPECGLPLDTARGSAVPWEGRKQIGRLFAFRRTCSQAMFYPRQLAGGMGFPTDANSARLFRLIVTTLATLPLAIAVTVLAAAQGWSGFVNVLLKPGQFGWPLSGSGSFPLIWEVPVLWLAGLTTWAVLPIGIFITIYSGTGILGFWVRPRDWPIERRNRATAISAYVCAPLVLIFVPTITHSILFQFWDSYGPSNWRIVVLCMGIEAISVFAIVLIYVGSALKVISTTTHCGWGRSTAAFVGLPICWALSAVIGLGLYPMLVGLIRIMIQSVRT